MQSDENFCHPSDIWGQQKQNSWISQVSFKGKAWKSMKKKTALRPCPDDDTLDHSCTRANYLSYIQLHPEVYNHPSPIGI